MADGYFVNTFDDMARDVAFLDSLDKRMAL